MGNGPFASGVNHSGSLMPVPIGTGVPGGGARAGASVVGGVAFDGVEAMGGGKVVVTAAAEGLAVAAAAVGSKPGTLMTPGRATSSSTCLFMWACASAPSSAFVDWRLVFV